MRGRSAAALTALVLAVGLVLAGCSDTGAHPAPGRAHIPTLAYYYQWFTPSSWDRAKVDYPLVGRYSSDDEAVMRRQVAQAKAAGIDGFIVSWKDLPVNNRRLEALMAVARSMSFKLAVIYEGLNFGRAPLPARTVGADLQMFLRDYAADPVFKIFDKPLVIWSGTWKFSAEDIERVTRPLRASLLVLASEKSPQGYARVAHSVDGDAYYWSSVNPAADSGYPAEARCHERRRCTGPVAGGSRRSPRASTHAWWAAPGRCRVGTAPRCARSTPPRCPPHRTPWA